jgi:hypothetical protein
LAGRQAVDQPKPGVMTGGFVFSAGVAQPDDQTYGHVGID